MTVHCASEKKSCRNAVEYDGYWCTECQDELASSRQIGDAILLARVPNLDTMYQARLATHPQALVRMILINERTDLVESVRGVLLNDADDAVLEMAAAVLEETSNGDLFQLLYRDQPELLFHLASNRHLRPEGLQMLSGHPDPVIASRAGDTIQDVIATSSQQMQNERRNQLGTVASLEEGRPGGVVG